MANLSVTKKVRMAPREAATLRRLAKARGQTESDVLREGLRLIQVRDARVEGVERYSAWLGDEKEPPKIRFKLK